MKKRYVSYVAVFDDSENEKELYTVTFPDIPGCISQGKGISEAMVNASEALGLMLFDEDNLPAPSSIEKVEKDNPNKRVALIATDLKEAKKRAIPATVKKNTTIPAELAIKAEKEGINFSKTLSDALKEKLQA